MTRTEQLGLCTWVESDPVSLTQMNENFTRLDAAGGKALSRADAANVNLAGLLLHSRHAGEDISFAQRVMVADLTRREDTAQYSQLYFSSAGARLLSEGYSGEEKAIRNPGGTSIVVYNNVSPLKIWTFTPSAYGRLSKITIKMSANSYGSFTDQLFLYSGGVLVASSDEYVKSDSNAVLSFDYEFSNFLLDPNKSYDLYFNTTWASTRTISSATITAAPQIYTSGWSISRAVQLPEDAERAVVHLYAAGTAPTLERRFDGGAWSTVSAAATLSAASQTGAACKLYRYEIALSGGETMQLRVRQPAADSVAYGLSAAIL